ncbi:MAG: hypothetical protein AAFV29_08745 [Myxococcota bacterium]
MVGLGFLAGVMACSPGRIRTPLPSLADVGETASDADVDAGRGSDDVGSIPQEDAGQGPRDDGGQTGAVDSGQNPPPDSGTGGGEDAGRPTTGQPVFALSFERAGCAAENAGFTDLTNANCDETSRATDGNQSATLNFGEGRNMIATQGAFSMSSGTLWLSYDMYAPRQPTFTTMMDAWQRGLDRGDANNPWSNRNPFSIEWRDGWFAMNCSYPNDHGTERRSEEFDSDLGVGSWVNVVVRYNLDTEQGAFWIRRVSDNGRPQGSIDPSRPAGTVDCGHYGDRGAINGLALTDFQNPDPSAVTVFTDRWILATSLADLP